MRWASLCRTAPHLFPHRPRTAPVLPLRAFLSTWTVSHFRPFSRPLSSAMKQTSLNFFVSRNGAAAPSAAGLASKASVAETPADSAPIASAAPASDDVAEEIVAQSKRRARRLSDASEPAASTPASSSPSSSPKKRQATSSATSAPSSDAIEASQSTPVLPSEIVSAEKTMWMQGDRVLYGQLCETFDAITDTKKRLAIHQILASYLRRVIAFSPQDLLPSIYLCVNRIAPAFDGIELGVGETILIKAISAATGRPPQSIKVDYETEGDLGIVAQASRTTQKTLFKPKVLSLKAVFDALKEIAHISGGSSQQKKVDKISTLLVSCRGNEARYLIRSLEGKLRIGLAEQSVLIALAHAIVLSSTHKPNESVNIDNDPKLAARLEDAVAKVKQAYSEVPSYDVLVPVLLRHGVESLEEHCALTPGVPVKPMLAHPTKSISEVLNRFEGIPFTCEFKYDGERSQIHKLEDGRVLLFSRNLENLTSKYPDIVDRLQRIVQPTTTSFILDCEAVAWDRADQKILPFQILSTRKRKDVASDDVTVQVCLFAFDLISLNGRSLLREPLVRRRELLRSAFQEVPDEFTFARYEDCSDTDAIQAFLEDSKRGNCEGLMVKTLEKDSTYEPSKRSRNWLKVKKDYLDGVGDSVDLVVIGAYTGRGKRTGVYGGYLLACYDPDTEEFQSICKIGTGFSEEALQQHADALRQSVIPAPKSYYRYGEGVKPDVWFDATQVWEVKAADLSISPIYQAAVGIVDSSKGVSLRFPRFLRIRDDKNPDDATTSTQIAEMYRSQAVIQNNAKPGDDFDDDE